MKRLLITLILALTGNNLSAQTLTLADSTITQAAPYKMGLNIGYMDYWDEGELLKNLLASDNAGFEPLQLRQRWVQQAAGTTTQFTVNDPYVALPVNVMTGASFMNETLAAPHWAVRERLLVALPEVIQMIRSTPCPRAPGRSRQATNSPPRW